MHELYTARLERGATAASLAPPTGGLVPAPDRHRPGRQRGGGQLVDDARPRPGTRGVAASAPPWGCPPLIARPAGPSTRAVAPGGRSLWLPGAGLDPQPNRRPHSVGIRHLVPPAPCRPLVRSDPLEPAKTSPPRPPTRRSGDCPLARGHVARHQKGAQAQQQRIFFIDESGFYPPSVVRTYAPVGQTPILRVVTHFEI
jgi:hypothetical protein